MRPPPTLARSILQALRFLTPSGPLQLSWVMKLSLSFDGLVCRYRSLALCLSVCLFVCLCEGMSCCSCSIDVVVVVVFPPLLDLKPGIHHHLPRFCLVSLSLSLSPSRALARSTANSQWRYGNLCGSRAPTRRRDDRAARERVIYLHGRCCCVRMSPQLDCKQATAPSSGLRFAVQTL